MREIELAHEREMAEMRFEFERKSAIAKRSSRERVTSERSDSSEGEEEEEEGRREKVNVRKSSKILSRSQVQARKFMPKSLPSFDGKLENWPLFYNSYKDTTEACGYSHLENLQRLRECLKGDALEAVRSRLLEPESVPGVIEDLRCLFGRPERLLKSLLTKVRNTPPPDANKLVTFITFGIAVKQLCDHLRAAQLEEHLNNPLLVDELVEKLPADYQMQWVRYKRYNCGRVLGVFANFIDEIMTDASEVAKFEEKKDERHRTHKRQVQANVFAHSEMTDQSAKMKTCWMCKSEQHRVRDCDKFKSNAVSGRLELVSKLNLCKSCLNSHKGTCRFTKRCTFDNCNEEHHPLLHQQKAENANEGCNAHRDTRKETIFRVVAVTLRAGDITYDTTAFLDEGSSVTMLEDGVADKLQVKGDHEPFTISWTAEMTRREENSRKVNILLSATGSPEQFELRGIRTVSKLVIPKQELSLTKVKAQYEHLKDIPIQDKCAKVPRMLIGLDHLHLFAPIESRIGQPNEPIGVKTKLGWTIYGPKPEKKPQVEYIHFHTTGQISNEKLHDVIRDCYRIEESGISSARAVESDDDRRARDLLESTTTRIGERFKTGLLWKNGERNFPESFTMAKRRLAGLERKLMKDSQLERAVRKLIDEYTTKEYAHKITKKELEETPASSVWYLPLNVVQNPRKPGKIRLVWDAAATVRGVSLNSELLKGPDMLCSLPSVIFPFRERRIGFGGDIKEMYHQIKISEEDKQAQKFLFTAGSGETDPQIFVMDVATFGATCSPCIAQYVKNLNAEQHREQYPEACAAIQLRHYVDDYFDSADTVDEALKLAKDVKYVHSRGGFLIRNWVSNAETFCTDMGEETAKSMIHLSDKSGENASDRVLAFDLVDSQNIYNVMATVTISTISMLSFVN
ncbi:uncharacterized protein LOC125769493 [Anopheles funestus]|uniref:uncharacterized protein LOC125769493 n=1 Tax=Anopheles funestus TaxID=62324 RepID=UPI0020C66688|nr:uncharacterized protein LOC125769493 [Anopheles funestus]